MRKFLISAALATAALTATAVPAVAQDYRGGGWNQRGGYDRQAVYQLSREIQQLETRIQRSYQRQRISRREAVSLQREITQIRHRLNRASRDGLDRREFYRIRSRINDLQQQFREERRDRDGRRY